MGIDFYYFGLSAPCRAVRMAAEAIGVPLNLKEVDLMTGAQNKPDFLKINPRHAVPAIDDNGFHLAESRAILQYFANAYSKKDSIYPKPAKQRALVDQMLYFDMGALYKAFAEAYYPTAFEQKPLDSAKVGALDTQLAFLEDILAKWKYAAGDEITIADFTIVATLSSAEACGHKLSKFSSVDSYLQKCKKEIKKYKELNQDGADIFKQLMSAAKK